MDRWLVRMARWVRNPPSEKRLMLIAAVVVICLVIYGIERLGLWPAWASRQRVRFRP